MQLALRQAAIMDIAQTMNGLRQTHRLALQLRQQVLQLWGIGMQILQVRL